MDVDVSLEARCSAEELFVWVDDLGRYPQWLDLVPRAEPTSPVDGDPGPAWAVDLQARLGPLARSKRLRMVRTVHHPPATPTAGDNPPATPTAGDNPPAVARFERREHDSREHSAWSLEARVVALGDHTSRLTMYLHYGGGLFGPVVEGLLREEVSRSRPRLLALVDRS